ncbi:chemokine-like factor [Elgaria multicarinata webbii]|uniref:chemokine-like factor n=1 Tax=Elgaria multicarinata webbii TaxID=159646 RepID=UPI002FCCDB28
MVAVNQAFLRSVRGGLKIARMVIALAATISFGVGSSHEAYLTLAIIELVVTSLFFVLYLLELEKLMKCLFWPLADAFNSLVAALFLFILGLCATIIKSTRETFVGGVFLLILCVLCIADAAILLRKVTFNNASIRNIFRR